MANHVSIWDAQGCGIVNRSRPPPPPRNIQEMKTALLNEWDQLPHELINCLISRRAEVDMPLRRFRRQYEQLSQFDRGRIIGMMEPGWSARGVARQFGRFDCVVRRCWDQ
ncbi:uncharacterized protein TNCV_851211 [Trichonephila clavipes]|nr:uncharacterized protein TNCV_851211 [Trichonephila clavipes]